MDAGALYAGGTERVTDLVRDLPESQLDRPVPAAPGWTVKDVVGHLTGVAADVVAGRLDGAGTPPWTARQVAERRDRPLASVLDEWRSVAPGVQAILATAPPVAANRLLCDVACHEHDIRGGLGRPGERETDTVDQALQAGVAHLDSRLRRTGGPGLRLVAGETEWIVGPGPPGATMTTDAFTLFRLLFGRRSRAQMAALPWTGDPGPYLDELALFDPAALDIDE